MTSDDTHYVFFYDAVTDTHYRLSFDASNRPYIEALDQRNGHREQQRELSCESLTFYIACTPIQNEVLHFSLHVSPTTSFNQLTIEPTTQATHYILLPQEEHVFTFLKDTIHTSQANRALPYEITHDNVVRLMSHIDLARIAYPLASFSDREFSENAPEAGCNARENAAIATTISWSLAGMAFGLHAIPVFAALGFCLGHLAFGEDEASSSRRHPALAYQLSTVERLDPTEEEDIQIGPS